MKNTVAGIFLALIAMTVYGCDQKKKTCEEKDAVTCHIVEKHIPASDVLYLKAYPLSFYTKNYTLFVFSLSFDKIGCGSG